MNKHLHNIILYIADVLKHFANNGLLFKVNSNRFRRESDIDLRLTATFPYTHFRKKGKLADEWFDHLPQRIVQEST